MRRWYFGLSAFLSLGLLAGLGPILLSNGTTTDKDAPGVPSSPRAKFIG